MRLYRIVATNPPTRIDFVSHAARGRRVRADPEGARLATGLSLYDTWDGAANTARDYPKIGAFIAAVDVPDDGRYRLERTTASAGHWTAWGDADALLACVVSVTPVQ